MELAERLNAPVLTTFRGKGLVSDRHPLGCGVLGRFHPVDVPVRGDIRVTAGLLVAGLAGAEPPEDRRMRADHGRGSRPPSSSTP